METVQTVLAIALILVSILMILAGLVLSYKLTYLAGVKKGLSEALEIIQREED